MMRSAFKRIEAENAALVDSSADHICRSGILFAGWLPRVVTVVIVVPISLSSLCVPSKEDRWIAQRLPWRTTLPMPVSAVREEPTVLEPNAPTMTGTLVSLPPSESDSNFLLVEIAGLRPVSRRADPVVPKPEATTTTLPLVSLPASELASSVPWELVESSSTVEPAAVEPEVTSVTGILVSLPPNEAAFSVVPMEIAETKPTRSIADVAAGKLSIIAEIAPQEKPTAGIMVEVDGYLWEVYQRSPIKRDSAGYFTWKDPVAAARFGLSVPAYVIGGMDPDFREQLYHAGRAMDAAGIRWSILSGFRDDYRQSIASGFKMSAGRSLHGGTGRTGGYGHGQAVDVASEDGNADAVWQWLDRHGAKFGLYRPMRGIDPAHVQPRGSWRDVALALRNARLRTADETHLRGIRTVNADDVVESRLEWRKADWQGETLEHGLDR
jgi:hypothetical protein